MTKHSKQPTTTPTHLASVPGCTIGLDVSDDSTQVAVLNGAGQLVAEQRIRTREPELRRWLAGYQGAVVALETGTHSPWMARVGQQCGHQVLVANARELRLIYGGTNKTDRLDAVKLARLARVDPALLNPITHRGEQQQADLAVIAARELLVKMRTEAINFVRGSVKPSSARVPACAAETFTSAAAGQVPELLRNALAPLLEQIDRLSEQIREYDERLEHLAQTRYPETKLLTQVAEVGTLTALTFRLTLGEVERFTRSRDVGCYVGLRPKRDQSGARPAVGHQ